ncbi:hypothetical protein D3C71_1608460 [compost metagenome]
MHDHPEGEIGERAARFVTRLIDDNFGQALLAHQAGLHVLKHQRQKCQRGVQACTQGWLAHAGTAHECQAATAQTARVHREKLVVAAPGQQAPQAGIGLGTDPCLWQVQLFNGDARPGQQAAVRLTGRAGLQQRFAHQLHGNGVFLAHRRSCRLNAGHLRPPR